MTKSGKHMWKRGKLLVLGNFFFCHYVFKNPSAAEASESVYMRERVKLTWRIIVHLFTACLLTGNIHTQRKYLQTRKRYTCIFYFISVSSNIHSFTAHII